MQGGMLANQLASTIDPVVNINFLKIQKRQVLYFLCVVKKVYQGNIPIMKTILELQCCLLFQLKFTVQLWWR